MYADLNLEKPKFTSIKEATEWYDSHPFYKAYQMTYEDRVELMELSNQEAKNLKTVDTVSLTDSLSKFTNNEPTQEIDLSNVEVKSDFWRWFLIGGSALLAYYIIKKV